MEAKRNAALSPIPAPFDPKSTLFMIRPGMNVNQPVTTKANT
jgi:hypothetical protein